MMSDLDKPVWTVPAIAEIINHRSSALFEGHDLIAHLVCFDDEWLIGRKFIGN
jgi:hypothetical protein